MKEKCQCTDCLSIGLSVCLSVCLSVRQYIYLSFYLSVSIICLFQYPRYISIYMYLSTVCLSIYVSISIYLLVCLSILNIRLFDNG